MMHVYILLDSVSLQSKQTNVSVKSVLREFIKVYSAKALVEKTPI